MRRAAIIAAAFVWALLLLIGASALGQLVNTPQITYSGKTNDRYSELYAYDTARRISMPMLRDIDQLPVAWSWSPDGKRLAYVLLNSSTGDYEIWLWAPFLRQPIRFAASLPFGSPPQWSPDGTHIVAVDARQDICIYHLNGAAADCLNVQPAGKPAWSSDGAAIAYLSRLPEGGLLRIDIVDGLVTPLFTGVNGVDNPRWSPDSASVLFSYQPDRDALRHLYTIPGGGGEIQPVTSGDTWQEQAQWSPDGAYLAYNEYPTRAANQPDIAVLNLETGVVTAVTTLAAVDTDARWSPDGRYLAFVSDRFDGRPRLQIVAESNFGDVEPLADGGIPMLLYAYAWRP